MSNLTNLSDRNTTRQRIRRMRQEFRNDDRLRAESAVAERLSRISPMHRARHIAIYFAVDGELSLDEFATSAARRGQCLYAPVISDDEIQFRLFSTRTPMTPNRFGIPEPSSGPFIDARSLDLVLTPLVAFDGKGVRLGMGGGFYDRRFQFLRSRSIWRKPKLIGVAFDFQFVEKLESQVWDVNLDCAVTETQSRIF